MTTAYFSRLIDRAVGRAPVLQPLVPSRFEPSREAPHRELDGLAVEEAQAAAAPGAASARPATEVPAAALPSPGAEEERAPSTVEDGSLAPPRAAVSELADRPAQGGQEPRERRAAVTGTERMDALEERLLRAVDAVRELRQRVDSELPSEALAAPPPLAVPPRTLILEARPPAAAAEPGAIAVARASPLALGEPAPLSIGEHHRRSREDEALARLELPPAIHVTIGRVEVRAVAPPAVSARPGPRRVEAPVSLDEYLRRRDRGGG